MKLPRLPNASLYLDKALAKNHHHVAAKAHSINQNARTRRIVGRTKKGVSGKFYKKLGLQTPISHPDGGRGRGMSYAVGDDNDDDDDDDDNEARDNYSDESAYEEENRDGVGRVGRKVQRTVNLFDSEEEKSGGEMGALVREFSSDVANGAVERAMEKGWTR